MEEFHLVPSKEFLLMEVRIFFFLLMLFKYLERLVVPSHKCLNVEKIIQEPY
jgi:hypothetical protein